MFRKEYSSGDHRCNDCLQYIVLAVSPGYLNAYLEDKEPRTPLLEGLYDDVLAAKFGIVLKKEKQFNDLEVADWFCENSESELAAQYANGKTLLLLLCRQNAIAVGFELAKFHNKLSLIKTGKPAIYVSGDVVEAQRDVRIHFPEVPRAKPVGLEAARSYAMSHLAGPLVREIASLRLHDGVQEIDKEKIREALTKQR
ncbi:hypothetical protein M3Y94_00450700 [Aphelenchoides besseyi]|nr:hypothetical protein M3Y94_00450700 [Aphelenchoides besseyi]KAI6229306.1 hypothetical protein M3Y95_00517300 [Aphelenchoides besseyi]